MARPELQRQETVVRWRLRKDLLEGFEGREEGDSLPNTALMWLAQAIAMLGEPLLWLAAAGLLVLLIRAMWRHLSLDTDPKPRPDSPIVKHIAGLDLRPETLPDDIPGSAAQLWHDGKPAAALSLLYRGAVARLVEEGLELRESSTEDDCLSSARLRDEDTDELLPTIHALRRRHLVLVASTRELALGTLRDQAITSHSSALDVSATHHYLAARTHAHAAVRAAGAMVLDVEPPLLPVALATRYLDIKRAGQL